MRMAKPYSACSALSSRHSSWRRDSLSAEKGSSSREQWRPGRKGADERHALTLAAGQRLGPAVKKLSDADRSDKRIHDGLELLRPQVKGSRAVDHVLAAPSVRKQDSR